MFLTLLLIVAVLALFVQSSSSASSEGRRVVKSSKRGRTERKAGHVRSGTSRESRVSSSMSAQLLAALYAEDDEDESNQPVGKANNIANVDHLSKL